MHVNVTAENFVARVVHGIDLWLNWDVVAIKVIGKSKQAKDTNANKCHPNATLNNTAELNRNLHEI